MNYRMDNLTEAKITKILDGDTLKVTLPNGFIITDRKSTRLNSSHTS